MAHDPVNIGTGPNAGNGDPLRQAFAKINDDLAELFAGLATRAPADSPHFSGVPEAPTAGASPSTQIANTRPIYSRPTEGSTGWMMIRKAPAMAAVAMEIPKAMRLMRIGSAAMSRKASWSCATAMMARPVNVRVR